MSLKILQHNHHASCNPTSHLQGAKGDPSRLLTSQPPCLSPNTAALADPPPETSHVHPLAWRLTQLGGRHDVVFEAESGVPDLRDGQAQALARQEKALVRRLGGACL